MSVLTAQVEKLVGRGLGELAAILVLEVLLMGSVLLLNGVNPSGSASNCGGA